MKLELRINGENVDPLSCIAHRSKAFFVGRELTKKLKTLIPRAQYKIPIQAAIGGKVPPRVFPVRWEGLRTGHVGVGVCTSNVVQTQNTKGSKAHSQDLRGIVAARGAIMPHVGLQLARGWSLRAA